LTTKIVNQFKQRIEQMTLVPSDGGRFEVSLDGDLVYSKLETDAFPDEAKVIDQIANRL